MRVVAGKFRGKRILDPIDVQTRPLKDLTKESIFNIIHHSNKFSNIRSFFRYRIIWNRMFIKGS